MSNGHPPQLGTLGNGEWGLKEVLKKKVNEITCPRKQQMSRVMVEFPTSWQTHYCKSPTPRGVLSFRRSSQPRRTPLYLDYHDPSIPRKPPPGQWGEGGCPSNKAPYCEGDQGDHGDQPKPPSTTRLSGIMGFSPQHTILEGSWRAHSFRSQYPKFLRRCNSGSLAIMGLSIFFPHVLPLTSVA